MRTPVAITLGTSRHSWEAFRSLVEKSGAGAVVDVRARPVSRYAHFCRPQLEARLLHSGWPYVWLGDLGGAAHDDRRSYAEIARTERYAHALGQVLAIAQRCPPLIICAEGRAIECHRGIQIAPALIEMGVEVLHMAADGTVQTHRQLEAELVTKLKLRSDCLWQTWQEIVQQAFLIQERKIRGIK